MKISYTIEFLLYLNFYILDKNIRHAPIRSQKLHYDKSWWCFYFWEGAL